MNGDSIAAAALGVIAFGWLIVYLIPRLADGPVETAEADQNAAFMQAVFLGNIGTLNSVARPVDQIDQLILEALMPPPFPLQRVDNGEDLLGWRLVCGAVNPNDSGVFLCSFDAHHPGGHSWERGGESA